MVEGKLLVLSEIEERNIAVLRVTGKLSMEHRRAFSSYCNQLIQSERSKKVIDLTRCESLFSIYFGSLVDLCQRIEAAGTATVTILTNDHLHDLFKKANLADLLPLVPVKVPVQSVRG
jgi:anti-anti-sigma factor